MSEMEYLTGEVVAFETTCPVNWEEYSFANEKVKMYEGQDCKIIYYVKDQNDQNGDLLYWVEFEDGFCLPVHEVHLS